MTPAVLRVAVATWALLLTVGMGALLRYSAQPGVAAEAPSRWPAESTIRRPSDRPKLLMVLHPHCTCSRASVAELARLLTKLGERVEAHVVFVRTARDEAEWERTDLWRSAASIAGVTVGVDEGGVEAARFGAFTSGQVYLYDQLGELRFHGGITQARGHMGDSLGALRVASVVLAEDAEGDESAVYGCSLGEMGKGGAR